MEKKVKKWNSYVNNFYVGVEDNEVYYAYYGTKIFSLRKNDDGDVFVSVDNGGYETPSTRKFIAVAENRIFPAWGAPHHLCPDKTGLPKVSIGVWQEDFVQKIKATVSVEGRELASIEQELCREFSLNISGVVGREKGLALFYFIHNQGIDSLRQVQGNHVWVDDHKYLDYGLGKIKDEEEDED